MQDRLRRQDAQDKEMHFILHILPAKPILHILFSLLQRMDQKAGEGIPVFRVAVLDAAE